MRAAILSSPWPLLALLLAWPLTTHAQDCNGDQYRIEKFTGYNPGAGGMNGSCDKSKSGLPACTYSMESYLGGRAPTVMAAVVRPQKERNSQHSGTVYMYPGSSALYGGIYQTKFPQSPRNIDESEPVPIGGGQKMGWDRIKKANIYLMAGDRYAGSYEGKAIDGSQMDLVFREKVGSPICTWIASQSNVTLTLCKRIADLDPPIRKIGRNYKKALEKICDNTHIQIGCPDEAREQ